MFHFIFHSLIVSSTPNPKVSSYAKLWNLCVADKKDWLVYCLVAQLLTVGHAQGEAALLSPGQFSREEYNYKLGPCALTSKGDLGGGLTTGAQLCFQGRLILAARKRKKAWWKWFKQTNKKGFIFFMSQEVTLDTLPSEAGSLHLCISFRPYLSIFTPFSFLL